MKRKLALLFMLAVSVALLTACAPTKKVISTIKHTDEIGFHIAKNAYLQWIPGKQIAKCQPKSAETYQSSGNQDYGLGGLLATIIVASVEHQQRKNNPSEYIFEYGKADEAVFMTSLRNALNEQQVFKNTELTSNDKVSSQDILIKIFFKTTRVVGFNTLIVTAKMTILTNGKNVYERTYLVESGHKLSKFIEIKTQVSKQLLADIIGGIKQWHEESKK